MVRSDDTPLRIEPHRGQVPENASESSSSERCGVLHEDKAWDHLPNDPSEFDPEPGRFAFDSFSVLSTDGDVGTREPASDDIHESSPRSPVERSDIIPDCEGLETAVVLAREEDVPSVGVEFDGADGSPTEELASEQASTSAREKCQLIQTEPHRLPLRIS